MLLISHVVRDVHVENASPQCEPSLEWSIGERLCELDKRILHIDIPSCNSHNRPLEGAEYEQTWQ